MPKKPTSFRKGAALVKQWAPRFGLSHYKSYVSLISEKDNEENLGQSFYDHHEEWYKVDLPADATMGEEERQMLVLHELAHGLISYALTGDEALETTCNRIARLALGNLNADGPRYHHCQREWAKPSSE